MRLRPLLSKDCVGGADQVSSVCRVVKRSGDYHQIFTRLLRSSIEVAKAEQGAEGSANGAGEPKKLEVQSYDVVRGEFPSEEEVRSADGVLITGSGALDLPLVWFE